MAATTEKVSVSLATEDLAWIREKAKSETVSLSAALSTVIRRQRQSEALRRLLDELGTEDLTTDDLEAARAERR
jgi:hypothetical protein